MLRVKLLVLETKFWTRSEILLANLRNMYPCREQRHIPLMVASCMSHHSLHNFTVSHGSAICGTDALGLMVRWMRTGGFLNFACHLFARLQPLAVLQSHSGDCSSRSRRRRNSATIHTPGESRAPTYHQAGCPIPNLGKFKCVTN